MPRKPRIKSSKNCYHVISRGINKMPIFNSNLDKYYFLSKLKKYSQELDIKIYAYCLMDNHIHILLGNIQNNLSTFMKKLGDSYVAYFNKKYDRIGSLFQDRFKSEPVEDEEYFLTLVRYILQNPQKAGICNALEYQWSSIKAFWYKTSFVTTDFTIQLLGGLNNLSKFLFEENNDTAMEYLPVKETKNLIQGKIEKLTMKLNLEDLKQIADFSIPKRNRYINFLRINGLTIKQISSCTGIPRGIVQNA